MGAIRPYRPRAFKPKLTPMPADQDRSRMWASVRQLRRFVVADIEATAETPRKSTEKYVRGLVRAEYLRCLKPQQRGGKLGSAAVYQLLRDTGPLAPRIGKQGVLDPNLTPAKPEPGDEPVTMKRRDYDRALLCVRACAGMTDEEIALKAGAGLPLPQGEGGAERRVRERLS